MGNLPPLRVATVLTLTLTLTPAVAALVLPLPFRGINAPWFYTSPPVWTLPTEPAEDRVSDGPTESVLNVRPLRVGQSIINEIRSRLDLIDILLVRAIP